MWGRFPHPGLMMGPGSGPGPMMGPGPVMGPGPGPMMGHGPMMGQGPMMGPGPMMGHGQGPMMGHGPGPMMGPSAEGMWGRYLHPGPMMGPHPDGMGERGASFDQMMSKRTNDPSLNPMSGGSGFPGSPRPSGSRDDRDLTSASLPKKEAYQEPDSSTSFEGYRSKMYVKEEEEEEEEEEEAGYYNYGPYCEVCELRLPSEHMLWRHMSGKKHLKAMKALDSGRPLPKKIQERKEIPSSSPSREEVSSFERAFASLTADEPVVGLGFVVETYSQTEEVLTCELCDSKCNQNNMVLHVLGLKHRMTYLKKCDPERYTRLKKHQKRSLLTEDTRQLCKEVESLAGRGQPRYIGPKHRQMKKDFSQFERRELTAEERRFGIEDLKRILMQDFLSRNMDHGTAQEMLEERLQLMKEYEKRGVPFDLAKERVIEDEDRWNLLLEFERQTLTFDEAEERISYRMDLLKAYIVNDCPKEEARKKVLDDEVIRNFRKEFQRLGMEGAQAQKQVEKRLWMLERLHYKGFSQEEASQKVMKIERELGKLLHDAKEKAEKNRQTSELFAWMKAGEDLEKFIEDSFFELGLSSAQREKHIKVALDSLDKYRKKNLSVDKAKKKVLVEDLPIPEDESDEEAESLVDKKDAQCDPEETAAPLTSTSSTIAGTKEDIVQRVKLFMTKLYALLQIDQQSPGTIDKEKQLAMFDQFSQLEMQNLLSDLSKSNINPYEAKSRFVGLFRQHESLRQSLFPFTKQKESSSHERLNSAFKMFMQHYSLSEVESLPPTRNRPPSKDKSSSYDSRKPHRARSRSVDRRGHSSKRRGSRSRRLSSSDRSLSDCSLKRQRARSRSVDRHHLSSRKKSRSRSRSTHRRVKRGRERSKRSKSPSYPSSSKMREEPKRRKHLPSSRQIGRYRSRGRSRNSSRSLSGSPTWRGKMTLTTRR